jgi:putative ABC transport system permease protein
MHPFRQFAALLRTSLSEIPQRIGPVLTIVFGVTCAVGVLVSMLAMGVGARQQAVGDVRDDRVIFLSTGAEDGGQSSIPKDQASSIATLPGIRKGANGKPIAVFQTYTGFQGRKRTSGDRVWFPIIGVSPGMQVLAPEIRITDGKWFRPGLHELVASNACNRQFSDFELGAKHSLRGGEWVVVGHFDYGHSQAQCFLYADADSILSAFGHDTFNIVYAMLETPTEYSTLAKAAKASPTLKVDVHHEREVVEKDFKEFNHILNFTAFFVGAIVALGATLGAVNSLYAIVDSRRRELATLRAIGFDSGPIIASTLAESVLLAVPGALLGGCLAWLLFNGFSASPFGIAFQLAVTPILFTLGVGWSLLMGLIGGLLPAIRAGRVPVTTALRAT